MKTRLLTTNTLLLLAMVSFFSNAAVAGENGQPAAPADIVEELIEPYDGDDTPGGVVMVMRNGEVIYTRAFGMANLSHSIPFGEHTPTNIGSTSKQFTAFAIALLEEQGKLSVDDDIRTHIPELPELEDTVRLRHLLSHTSGYREYLNSFAMAARQLNDKIRREEIIPMVQRQPELQNLPGERYNYNNTGYALLSMVVERVTGESFPVWMNENVFEPLGMEQTVVLEHPGQVIVGRAQGYAVDADENTVVAMNDIYASMGAGGIYSTVADLEKWIRNFHEPIVGTPEIMEKMQTPFRLNSDESTGYGYGLIIGRLKGLKMVEHGGADVVHRSAFLIFPDIKGAVVTQSNNSSFAGQVASKVAEAFFSDVMDVDDEDKKSATDDFVYDPELFDELTGRYELDDAPGFVMEFTREGDTLYTQATGQGRVEIYADSDSTFYLTIVDARFTFHRNEDGEVDAMTLHQNGNHRATRLTEPAWEPSEEDLQQYLGRYLSDELEVFYTVAQNKDGELVLQNRRLEDIPLKAETRDEYSGGFPIRTIQFLRNEEGVVTGFEASSGRSSGILFEKLGQ